MDRQGQNHMLSPFIFSMMSLGGIFVEYLRCSGNEVWSTGHMLDSKLTNDPDSIPHDIVGVGKQG